MHGMVRSALLGVARPRSGPMVLGDWEVVERLGGTDTFTEYRGINTFAGQRGGTALLRVYQADPYLTDPEERKRERARIANAFFALNQLPGHPFIAGAKGFFATEEEDRYVLVTEDVAGEALRLHIDKPALALTLDQKLRVARELLEALAFCHARGVVHRDVSPATILIGSDGHIRLTGFEHARAGVDRSLTIAAEIADKVDANYAAPETWKEPANASPSSDVFAAGLVLYELFTGHRPFSSPTELFDQAGVFAVKPSAHRADIAAPLDAWLQRLCTFDPDQRITADAALAALEDVLATSLPAESEDSVAPAAPPLPAADSEPSPDWTNVPKGTLLAGKLEVQARLGRGTFGVVYKVVDTLGDVTRALKLILLDRHSTLERLKKEYKTLVHLPEHPHVVRVIDANVLPGDGPPYMLFEYVDGEDVGNLIYDARFAPEDALVLLRQVTEGLAHLHREGVYHCDIKPHNLLWTSRGAMIIDFNVAVRSQDNGHGGGSRRYLPPDLDLSALPSPSELIDRDLYALGLTVYEALTGRYPWKSTSPPPATAAPDPRELPNLSDLAPEFTDLLLKVIAPRRAGRFASAAALLEALKDVTRVWRETSAESSGQLPVLGLSESVAPNTNPFVTYLQTLYSQSPRSNAGTRGLDDLGRRTYVPTLLDDRLIPDVIAGRFRLVVITGNAGDGKTAFLQQLEAQAGEQAQLISSDALVNGRRFATVQRSFVTNYDGSQDEDTRSSDEVLRDFFAPFAGSDSDSWPDGETRLIAINEGSPCCCSSSRRAYRTAPTPTVWPL
jgi:serine/threonine protein kinase